MDPIEHVKTVLHRYPALAWLPETSGFHWEVSPGRVTITPDKETKIAKTWGHYFPVIVTSTEKVKLPAFGLEDYPSMNHRADLANGPNDAMVFVANRFYRAGGHSFLYLHYPTHATDDKIINFNAGKHSLGKFGMRRDVDFVHSLADGVTEPSMRGVTSFAGFPITQRQAQVLEADAILAMCNPHYIRYSLLNHGINALNCVGFAMSRLQNANEPLGQLTGKHHVPRVLDNNSLPDYRMTLPGNVHKDIRARIRESADRTVLPIHGPQGQAPAELLLARSPDGLLLGEMRNVQKPLPQRDQYLSHDIVALLDHLLPHVLNERAETQPLAGLTLPPYEGTAINTERQHTIRGLI